MSQPSVAVIIPCYKVKAHIQSVIAYIPPEVDFIFVVDDKCPEQSGQFVQTQVQDPRVKVLFHERNLGVGGAVVTGYRAAIEAQADILVKVDGDGQMDPALIPLFVEPIAMNRADYVKGNRFYSLEDMQTMPSIRLLGNIALSFINKMVSGYWDVMDPTNGYTAIHSAVAATLPLSKLSPRYFFESDMLFRLSTIRAVVSDVPMRAAYGDEKSNLSVTKVLFSFPFKYINRLCKRIVYNYYFRDFNFGSLMLILGLVLSICGAGYGLYYIFNRTPGVAAPSGVVMMSALPIILGFQSLIYFVQHDISSVPKSSIHKGLILLNKLKGASHVRK